MVRPPRPSAAAMQVIAFGQLPQLPPAMVCRPLTGSSIPRLPTLPSPVEPPLPVTGRPCVQHTHPAGRGPA
eukprot:6746686-Alexandrium_andersonii.AAC.1